MDPTRASCFTFFLGEPTARRIQGGKAKSLTSGIIDKSQHAPAALKTHTCESSINHTSAPRHRPSGDPSLHLPATAPDAKAVRDSASTTHAKAPTFFKHAAVQSKLRASCVSRTPPLARWFPQAFARVDRKSFCRARPLASVCRDDCKHLRRQPQNSSPQSTTHATSVSPPSDSAASGPGLGSSRQSQSLQMISERHVLTSHASQVLSDPRSERTRRLALVRARGPQPRPRK